MKITILQGAFLPVPPKLGGAVEKMWFALGKYFAKNGHEVIHISRAFPGMPSEELIDGVLHKRIRGYTTPSSGVHLKWLDLLYTLRARKIVPTNSDIIVTNTFWTPILFPSFLKIRCMVDVQRMPKGQIKWYTQSSRLRANSNPVAEAIKHELSSNWHNKVIIIPNPLPFDNWLNYNALQKVNVLLYTGRIHPEKGLEILIKAFKQIDSNWKLKIVGPWEVSEGGGGLSYFEFLKSLADESDVEFVGPVFDIDQLNKFYMEASIFIYPSIAESGETFGLAPLEAMAWGCVPIVSGIACFQDFIKNEHNGLIFNHRDKDAVNLLKNAIIRLEEDKSFYSKLANEGLKVRQTHSISYIASLFLEEFKKMADQLNPVTKHEKSHLDESPV